MKIDFNDPAVKVKTQQSMIMLGRLTMFIRKNYLERLAEVDVRFPTMECKLIVDKELDDVKAKLNAIDLGFVDLNKGLNKVVADHLFKVITTICEQLKLSIPSQDEIQFTLRNSEDFINKLKDTFPTDDMEMLRVLLTEYETISGQRNSLFQVKDLLNSMQMYFSVMRTLTKQTEFEGYEAFLKQKMSVDGYFTKGHHRDLLVYDVEDLRAKGNEIDGVYATPEKCNTLVVYKGEKPRAEFTILVQNGNN